MLLTSNRRAVLGAIFSTMFAFIMCTAVFAAPAQAGTLFNNFDLGNRTSDASAAIKEIGNKRIESVAAGIASNTAGALALAVDDQASVDFLAQSDLNQIPDSVLRAASCLGVPYRSGSSSPSGFDCSGLVSYALTGEYGHAYKSYDFWAMPAVDDPQPGDVVACSAGHCGLYVGDGLMIHSPQTGEVVRVEPIRGKIVRP